MPRNKILTLKK